MQETSPASSAVTARPGCPPPKRTAATSCPVAALEEDSISRVSAAVYRLLVGAGAPPTGRGQKAHLRLQKG